VLGFVVLKKMIEQEEERERERERERETAMCILLEELMRREKIDESLRYTTKV
jgi:hypothetical protein